MLKLIETLKLQGDAGSAGPPGIRGVQGPPGVIGFPRGPKVEL